jgi:hypothetical protein
MVFLNKFFIMEYTMIYDFQFFNNESQIRICEHLCSQIVFEIYWGKIADVTNLIRVYSNQIIASLKNYEKL